MARARWLIWSLCGLLLLAVLGVSPDASAQQRQEAAKEAFFQGKAAYEAGDFEKALGLFQRSYTLGEQPALLYNISSTLQNLNRPGEAAQALREFLRVRANDADRAALETRIANLERSQQLLDRDKERRDKLEREEAARRQRELERTAQPSPGWLSPADADARVAATREQEKKKRRKTLGIALGVSFGAIAVGTAVTLGILLSREDAPKDFDFGRVTVTR